MCTPDLHSQTSGRHQPHAKALKTFFNKTAAKQTKDKGARSNKSLKSRLLIQSPFDNKNTSSKAHHHDDERCLARSRLDHNVQIGTLYRQRMSASPLLHTPKRPAATYRTKPLSRQRHISALIDIQLIGLIITATLINRGVRLAIIPRAGMRTGIDDLHHNAIPRPANRAARVGGTFVRDLVASAAVVFWAIGS